MLRILVTFFLSVLPFWGVAQDWNAIEQPGSILLMRHALAPGTGDPSGFRLEDCTTQRNLDAQGRAQARRIGEALRGRGVEVDAVWTSQWCRSRETADLLDLGPVREVSALNSFFGNRSKRDAQTREVLNLIEQNRDHRLLLVSHQVNITALTGVFPRSGEIVATRWRDGALAVTGRVLIDP
ncbi:Histidine phosphatase superfamily (branch 1) [Salinihabitans flavidus]|uniref:Histidine phosphatase superfamily (Branch 1) n=1 Tax=Salinihabitans flavidus TaxID=569882 RepID=A0A1H8RQ92_9RHOB|nr:histidine phosphatase family protein [Salinihabitans flavidus]SEO68749.1 Histidine phosphatase superfamily (branch 1) [Salinihabitans flavidus]